MYAVQQRVAITSTEATFMLVMVALIGAGGIGKWLTGVPHPVDPAAYAELDQAFAAGAAQPPAGGAEELAIEIATPDREEVRPRRLPPPVIDLNTASPAMLERLPGIGPALAARIVEHREINGPFARPRDVIRVRGIGEKTFERLEPFLRVQPPAPDDQAVFPDPGSDASGTVPAPSPE